MFLAGVIITLLVVTVVWLLIHHGKNHRPESTESNQDNPLFVDGVTGIDNDPDEFAHRIYQTFSQTKKRK